MWFFLVVDSRQKTGGVVFFCSAVFLELCFFRNFFWFLIFCLCLLGSSGISLQQGCEAGRRLRVFPGAAGFLSGRGFLFFSGVFCLLSTVYCLLWQVVRGWFSGAVFWSCGVFFCFFGVRGGCLPADVSEVLFSCIYNFCEFCSFCELFRQLLIGFSLYSLKSIIAEQKGVLSAIMRRWSGTFFRAWKNASAISWCSSI